MAHPHKPYHHGDLRRALLDAALQLTVEQGIEGFSLREVARRAGVSNAAPYRHFADRGALIEALAVDGWQALERDLSATWQDTPGDALVRVVALGVRYVQFALTHSEEFRLMVRPEFHGRERPAVTDSPVRAAAGETFRVLLEGIRIGQSEAKIVADDAQGLALTAWATVHGLTVILLDQLLPEGNFDQAAARQAAQVVTATLVRGLAVRAPTERGA